MKVYLPLLSSNSTLIKIDKIKKYLTKTTTTNYIYTPQGIFQIHKNKLMRMEIVDAPCKKMSFNIDDGQAIKAIDYTIDYSTLKIDEEAMQLPVEHYLEQITHYEYSLRPGGQVHLIQGPIQREMYFLANDDIDIQILNDDIITFLEELKVLHLHF